MNPREKRTSTQPGLGQVQEDARRTAVRERVLPEGEVAGTPPPISGAPISGAPTSARHTRALETRHTRALESVPARTTTGADEIAIKPPGGKPVDRRAPTQPDYQSAVGGARVDTHELDAEERALRALATGKVECTRSEGETPRSPGVESVPITRRSAANKAARTIEGRASGDARAPAAPSQPVEGRPRPSERPGSRTVDGRPIGGASASRPAKPLSSKPPAAKPASSRPVGRGVPAYQGGRVAESTPSPSRAVETKPLTSKPPTSKPPTVGRGLPPSSESKPASASSARTATGSARSLRSSIRIDDLGEAVVGGPDAMGAGARGRQVPKIVRTKAEIAEAPIDHRAGFLLAHIDGVTSVQGLVDVAAMPENEVHEIIERLRRLGIVAIR